MSNPIGPTDIIGSISSIAAAVTTAAAATQSAAQALVAASAVQSSVSSLPLLSGGPSALITNTTYPSQLAVMNIPANSIGPGKQLVVTVSGTTSNSSNIKRIWLTLGGVQVGPTISNTTSTSLSGSFVITANNSLQSQTVEANFPNSTASTGNAVSLTYDMTKAQQVQIMGSIDNSSDSLVLNTYTIKISPIQSVTSAPFFHGANGHYTYTATTAQIIASLKLLGCTVYRFDVYPDVPSSLTAAVTMATALQGTGIQMYCLLGAGMESNPSNHTAYTSETAAYTATKAWATTVVQTLYPLGVTVYECGNELDAATAGGVAIRPTIAAQGTVPTDFVNSVWPLFRGVVCGLIDGVHAGNPNALAASNAFTNASIYASDALWNGLQPDGTSGHMQARWDITAWHLYTEGDATNTYFSGGGGQPRFNLLDHISKAYGKPIYISEWHPSQATDALNASVGVAQLSTWWSNRSTYNIVGHNIYSLYDAPWYLIPGGAGSSSLNLFGTAIQNFISTHVGV